MAKILVVDNEQDTVELVKTILEKEGYKIVEAFNGRDALAKNEKENPDLVLLDIMMPDLSGWDVYQRLRKKNPEAKVALLSIIEVSDDRRKRLLNEGLSDYVLKPFTAKELIERVRAIVKP